MSARHVRRCCEGQVCGTAGGVRTLLFAVVRTLLALAASRNPKEASYIGMLDIGRVLLGPISTWANVHFLLRPILSSTLAKFYLGHVRLGPILFFYVCALCGCVVWVCCVACVVCVVLCARRVGARRVGGTKGGGPRGCAGLKRGGPEGPKPRKSGGLKGWGARRVRARRVGGPKGGSLSFFSLSPEKPKLHGRGPRPQFHEKTSLEGKKSENRAGEEKKERKFGRSGGGVSCGGVSSGGWVRRRVVQRRGVRGSCGGESCGGRPDGHTHTQHTNTTQL